MDPFFNRISSLREQVRECIPLATTPVEKKAACKARLLLDGLNRLFPEGVNRLFSHPDWVKNRKPEITKIGTDLAKTLLDLPQSALIFEAAAIGQGQSIKIHARTGGEALQGYWGRCVHDLASFRAPTGNVVLDFAHDQKQDIGFARNVRIENGELVADGTLTPFKAGDKASEIVAKGKIGVPYQASIVMGLDGLQIDEVPAGKTVVVNGQNFSGPGVVFRNWTIDGIAILPYGSDSKTSIEFPTEGARFSRAGRTF